MIQRRPTKFAASAPGRCRLRRGGSFADVVGERHCSRGREDRRPMPMAMVMYEATRLTCASRFFCEEEARDDCARPCRLRRRSKTLQQLCPIHARAHISDLERVEAPCPLHSAPRHPIGAFAFRVFEGARRCVADMVWSQYSLHVVCLMLGGALHGPSSIWRCWSHGVWLCPNVGPCTISATHRAGKWAPRRKPQRCFSLRCLNDRSVKWPGMHH